MAHPTLEQRRAYWRFNVGLTAGLLAVWLGVTFGLAGALSRWLDGHALLGVPLGYWMAAQGSVLVFVLESALYAWLMNARDLRAGIREEG